MTVPATAAYHQDQLTRPLPVWFEPWDPDLTRSWQVLSATARLGTVTVIRPYWCEVLVAQTYHTGELGTCVRAAVAQGMAPTLGWAGIPLPFGMGLQPSALVQLWNCKSCWVGSGQRTDCGTQLCCWRHLRDVVAATSTLPFGRGEETHRTE